jgi:Bacterial cadherin-like domain
MNERIVVEHATKVQVANLAQSRTLKVTKPQGDQSIVLDLSDRNATFDLSAVADEKMTLVKVGPKLIILFDNQSTVTADPFFDFSGKPLANLDVELGAGRAINGEQFAQLFTITEDQSVLRAAGNNIPPSGADFHDVSIDPLPGGSRPLALLEQEGLGTRGSGVDDASSRHNIQTVSPKPVVTIPPPGGVTTQVFEAGLLASRGAGESAGTHAGQSSFPTTTKTGAINFNSPDGVTKVELGGHELSGTAQTFTDATGSLTASYTFNTATGKGTITYSYTLLDNTQGIPNASFAVVVTDKDGDSNPPVSLVISIVDDAPVARADTDTIAGQTMAATGNVLTGFGTASGPGNADVSGADGGATVVGVAPGNGAGGVNPGSVGIAIAGAFGTLTLNADGSYSYVHAVGGGADVFTYTIQDADGTLAHTTLTISLADFAPGNIVIPGPGGADTQVFEAGLLASRGPGESAGSHGGQSGFPTTTQAGTITFTSMSGEVLPPSRGGWPRPRRRRDLSERLAKSHC